MNKKYIDFVPVKPQPTAKKPAKARRPAVYTAMPSPRRAPTPPPAKITTTSFSYQSSIGIIEDLSPDEPKTETAPAANISSSKTMAIPKSPFINQNRVEKRPLSKNVYKKPIPKTEEPVSGPVTIIAKPEKEKGINLVITIIITIILGAVAGTVAFLLLPK